MTNLASLTDLSLDCLVTSSDPAVITFVNTKVSGGWSCHTISGNTGAGGASLNITDSLTLINRTALADTNGDYIFTLPRNSWSGVVTPSKSGYVFTPTIKNYTSISTDQSAQNYTAATFCSTITEIPQTECEALEALYNSTNGASWINHTNWLQTTMPSNWFGVTVLNGHVDRLILHDNHLNGAMPQELVNLTYLRYLILNDNQLTGYIPPEIGNLVSLQWLLLYDNQLSGHIPLTLGNLSNLSVLYLNNNQLSGNIPPELGNITNLTQLQLNYNQLSGGIPAELGNLTHLTVLWLKDNQLSGNIPPELGNLSQLTQLHLNRNQLLSGNIPPELGKLTNLTQLALSDNQLSGNIPPELGNLTQLMWLFLYNNHLTGNIPSQLGNLITLTDLRLEGNQLTGGIPPEFGNLTNLTDLKLNGNQLGGSIPPELGNLTHLTVLWLKDNRLSGSIPPELGNLSQLTQLHLNRNQLLSGSIPPELGKLTNLTQLALSDNQLSGNIPPELSNLTQLRWLFLYNNQLNGNIPPGLGNLITLTDLRLEGNQLVGEIPGTIVNLANLSDLRLDCTLTSSDPAVITFISAKSTAWGACLVMVTIEQTNTQPDPSAANAINFTMIASRPINISTFTSADISLGGTAGATTAVISEIAPNNGTTFNVAVSGMTGSGTVTASIGAAKVTDLASNPNTASASADNTVSYIYEPDTLFAHVPEITPGQDHSDVLITPDDIDVYKFDVAQPFTTIVAKLTPPANGDFTLYLFQGWDDPDQPWDDGRPSRAVNIGIGGNTDPGNPTNPDRSIEVRFNVRNDLANGKGTTYYLAIQRPDGGVYSADPYVLNVKLIPSNVSKTGLADSDGDGLPDVWESNGVTVDGVFVDLPAMGADPLHKDIFVELDYMVDHQPKPAAIAKIVQAFANAPVSNPDGTTGIRLHVDYGPESEMNPVTHALWGALSQSNSIAHQDSLGAGWVDLQGNAHYNWTDFDAIKAANFSNARAGIFHYGLFAHNLGGFGDTSGISRGLGASDFIVSLGSWSGGVGSVNEQAGTFMHELGHNLGLRHGGNDQVQYKPNFLSIMNYSFQTRGLSMDGMDGYFDYSRFDQPTLDETHLDESRGLNAGSAVDHYGTIYYCANTNRWTIADHANGPLDWNCNGNLTDSNVQADVNNDNHTEPLTGYNEWPNLIYAGGSIGAFGFTPETLPQTPFEEITQAQDALLPSSYNVTVTASPNRIVQTNSAVQMTFTVKNQGTHSDTYTLSASSSAGWASLGNVPPTLTLAAGQSAAIPVSVQVPAFASAGAIEKISLTAVSQTNANIEDQAIATLTAVDTPTPTTSPSPTGTMTATLTFTPTQTLTETLTLTPAPTFTLNPTGSSTPTVAPTPTKTVALTVTPTANATSTATLPSTPTPTATNTMTPAPAGSVVLAIVPAATTVNIGQSFSLTVQVQAGSQQVDGAAAYLNFDPAYLQVVSMSSGTTLPVVIQNSYDNTAGRIDYAAGKLSSPYPSGSFTLVTINFTARAQCSGATLMLNNTLPRKSDATFGGNSVINHTENSVVTITNYAVLNGHVALQGRPTPPNSQWVIPLSVNLYAPGESFPSYSFAPTTDNNGYFSIGNIAPGTYDVRIKNSHALQNKLTITLAGGNNAIDFGALREGDANNDGYVSLVDFSILANSYGKCQGAIGYDGRADFNEDGCVSLLDFSLMAANFGQAGTTAMKAQLLGPSAGNVQLAIEPAAVSVTSGQVFSMNVQVKAGAQQIDGAQASLDFNPALVHVKQLIAGAALPLNLQSQFDNAAGTIDFSAGTLSGFPSGTFTLVTVEFEAPMPTTGTNLAFHFGLPRDTGVTFGGESVLGGATGGEIIVLDTATPTSTRTPTPTPAATNTPTPTLTTKPTATRTPIITAQTFTSVAGQDGWILESSETSNVGGSINSSATTFNLGDSAAKQQYRGILSFNTGSLPDNAVITGVTLKFKQQAIVGGGNPVSIFQGFMFDVKNGFFGTAATLQTGDFQAAASQSYGPSAPAPVGGWYSFNLTNAGPFVNKLATNSGLTQIRLRFKLDDNNNAIANYLSLYSGNAPAENRPQLIIQYYVP
ncbi:MAG: DNRLRE domain-containing protein [Anaerolineales bacterium]